MKMMCWFQPCFSSERILIMLVSIATTVTATVQHKRLHYHLFNESSYNSAIRPVINDSTSTNVGIWLNIHQIRDLYERQQYLESLVWITFQWTDEFLTWNESEFNGLEQFHIPSSMIWRPDIALFNSVDDGRSAIKVFSETNAIIHSDGSVYWLTTALFKSSCQIDVASYPFDKQECVLRFGSWTYDMYQVNTTCLEPEAGMSQLVPNGEWQLTQVPCVHHEMVFPCCAEPFSDVRFTLNIERKPMFYLYNLLFPSACLLLIGMLVFWVPPESGEKTSMAVTILLAMTVFMLVITDNVPPTSEVVPLLAKFFGATTGLLSLVTIMAVLVVNVHHRSNRGKPPPNWVRTYILGNLAQILMMCDGNEFRREERKNTEIFDDDIKGNEQAFSLKRDNSPQKTNVTSSGNDEVLRTASVLLRHIEEMRDEKEKDSRIASEWSRVARVLDRLFLVIFIILCLVTVFMIFIPSGSG